MFRCLIIYLDVCYSIELKLNVIIDNFMIRTIRTMNDFSTITNQIKILHTQQHKQSNNTTRNIFTKKCTTYGKLNNQVKEREVATRRCGKVC